MAVPKRRKRSATKRQRNAKQIVSHKQFESFKDQSIRHEKNREKLGLDKVITEKKAQTVIAA